MTQMPPVQPASQTTQPRRSGVLGVIAIVLAVLALAACGMAFTKAKTQVGLAAVYLAAAALPTLVGLILGIVAVVKRNSKKSLGAAGLVLSLVAGLGLFMTLFPILAGARAIAQTSMCGANMNGIGKGFIMYQAEADDACPPDLKTLVNHGSVSPMLLTCPGARRRLQAPHYFYFPPTEAVPGSTFILCDLKGNHIQGQRNVLTYGASVELYRTEAEFESALARPENAAFAAALKKVDRP